MKARQDSELLYHWAKAGGVRSDALLEASRRAAALGRTEESGSLRVAAQAIFDDEYARTLRDASNIVDPPPQVAVKSKTAN